MAIHDEEIESHSGGFAKTIDEAGMSLILSNLQKYQYVYPIKSTVREIICNGIDSVAEKQVARKILLGEAKVEDFFVEREGPIYKDSHFDRSYYDLQWFSEHDYVELAYIVGDSMEKDKVQFIDHGVGLGGKRLEGYFKLSYSTKRLSKLPLGKFGIGAKSPLSVVDMYTIESRYNGRKFRFNIYSKEVDSIVPKLNLETGKENGFVLFAEGTPQEYKVYYEETDEKNGLTITLDAKKFQKKQYIEAVKSQLLYFPNIVFTITENGVQQIIDYRADILYEDDQIVLSNNNYYDKPHLLLNKVNYGYINWEELELENKKGNIGIKVAPEDVEVNPSRESIVWSDKTKEMVLTRFNSVVQIATRMIEKELYQDDFLAWLRTCYSLTSFSKGKNTVVGRLSEIVDLSDVKPSYVPVPELKFNRKSDFFEDLYVRTVKYSNEEKNNRFRKVVKRTEVVVASNFIYLPIYIMKANERASNRKDKWLLNQHPDGFAVVYEPLNTREEMILAGMSEVHIDAIMTFRNKNGGKTAGPVIFDLVKKSQGVGTYELVEVPEEFTGTEEEEEVAPEPEKVTQEEVEQIKVQRLTAKERREQEGKIIVNTLMAGTWSLNSTPKGTAEQPLKVYEPVKMEVSIKTINEWEAQEIYYGPMDERMHFIAMLTRDPDIRNKLCHPMRPTGFRRDEKGTLIGPNSNGWVEKKYYRLNKKRIEEYVGAYRHDKAYFMQHFFDTKIILVNTPKASQRYVRDFLTTEQFFIRIRNKVITMSNILVKWNTARVIRDKITNCSFLFNFESFNAEYAEMYTKLIRYIKDNYREVEQYSDREFFGLNRPTYEGLVKHLDNVRTFQEFVRKNPGDVARIGQLAQELFGNRELQDGHAVDPEIMSMLEQVLEYAEACGDMLNYMPILTGNASMTKEYKFNLEITRVKWDIPETLEHEIRTYLEDRGVLNFKSSMEKSLPLLETTLPDTQSFPVEEQYKDGLPIITNEAKLYIQE